MDPAHAGVPPQAAARHRPAGLFERLCRIHVAAARRDAPLWEQHVFTGLPGGRVALYFKTHHGLIDGIGFLHALNTIVATLAARERLPQAIWEGLRHYEPPRRHAAPTRRRHAVARRPPATRGARPATWCG